MDMLIYNYIYYNYCNNRGRLRMRGFSMRKKLVFLFIIFIFTFMFGITNVNAADPVVQVGDKTYTSMGAALNKLQLLY